MQAFPIPPPKYATHALAFSGRCGVVSDHFRSIGFTLEREELESLVGRAIARGTVIAARNGDYHVWTPGAGAELWVTTQLVDGRRQLAGATPHFNGDARIDAVVEAVAPDAEHALEGEIFAWASEGEDQHGLYPFSASVPDFDVSTSARDLPFRATLALVGFAHDFAIGEGEFGATSIVPLGIFGNASGRARSQAIVTGRLLASETRVNPATERPFRYLRVACYGGDIDILTAPEIVPHDLHLGSIVRATCWLTGRVLP